MADLAYWSQSAKRTLLVQKAGMKLLEFGRTNDV